MAEADSETPDSLGAGVKLTPTPATYALEHALPRVALYIPKRLLTIVVPDDVVTSVVTALIRVNQTGRPGDGQIFVSPVEGALRVRTGELNGEAIV
jgi:nitrogen regulatory protein PII 2